MKKIIISLLLIIMTGTTFSAINTIINNARIAELQEDINCIYEDLSFIDDENAEIWEQIDKVNNRIDKLSK